MHGGNLFGHYARLELFPDVNLGVYSSINGQEGFPGAMQSIGLFVGKNLQLLYSVNIAAVKHLVTVISWKYFTQSIFELGLEFSFVFF